MQGTLVTKASKDSPHKIDLAIGAIMCFDRWSDMKIEPEEEVRGTKVYKFMMINYLITGTGFLMISIAGFLVSPTVGFFVLGTSLLFGIVFDREKI